MDYEFRRNTLDDSFHCEFSMGHEAIGRWLLDEIGTDINSLNEAITEVEKVMLNGGEWQKEGRAFHLWINQEEAVIKANHIDEDAEIHEDDGLHSVYFQESIALCGLEDFHEVLQAWRSFLLEFGGKKFIF